MDKITLRIPNGFSLKTLTIFIYHVVVLPINSFTYKEISYKLPNETNLANLLKEELLGASMRVF